MARMTRAMRIRENDKQRALDLRDEVARLRSLVLVEGAADFLSQSFRQHSRNKGITEAGITSMYDALFEVEQLRRDYEKKLGWTRDKLDELTGMYREGRLYSGVPLQNVDDLVMTHGRLYTAIKMAVKLAYALGFRVPSLLSDYDRARIDLLLSFTVERTSHSYVVEQDGSPATDMVGQPIPLFDEEWLAWRAIAARTCRLN